MAAHEKRTDCQAVLQRVAEATSRHFQPGRDTPGVEQVTSAPGVIIVKYKTFQPNELTLTLKLAKMPSAPAIWTHTIHEKTSAVSWYYAIQADFTYDELLKQGMRDAVTSLAATARTLK